MKAYLSAVAQLYQPNLDAMRSSLPDIGSSLDTACCELARDLSLDKLDRLAARLNSAQTNLTHLRKALFAESVERHGTGITG
jgi:hypothetical protein